MIKRVRIALIIVMCAAICAAIVCGVVLYQREQRDRDIEAASQDTYNAYLRVSNLSDLVLSDYDLSQEGVPIDDTYIDNFSDLTDACREFNLRLRNLVEISDFEEIYPRAIPWLLEYSDYMSRAEKDSFNFESYQECGWFLNIYSVNFTQVLQHYEDEFDNPSRDIEGSLQRLIEA